MNKWQDPSLTLGERCVAFAENELANKVGEDKPGSYTSPRIREYFNICTRFINGKETNINFTAGNWCAASASFSLHESLLPNETPPHGYRLGVVEIVSNLEKNSLYQTIADVKNNKYSIKVGDVVIFDRSRPNDPSTAWFRHIGRVHSLTSKGFNCISGNSGGKWTIIEHSLSAANILGFGEYPLLNQKISNDVRLRVKDWSNIDINLLAPMEDTGTQTDHVINLFHDVFKDNSNDNSNV